MLEFILLVTGLQEFHGWKKKNALLAISETKSHIVDEGKKYSGPKSKSRYIHERGTYLLDQEFN